MLFIFEKNVFSHFQNILLQFIHITLSNQKIISTIRNIFNFIFMGSLWLVVKLFVFSITNVVTVNCFKDDDSGSNPGDFKYF